MSDPAVHLDALAATQLLGDAEVEQCWPLVRAGIQTGKVGLGNLDHLIAHLRAGTGMTLDALTIEADPDLPGRARVVLVDDMRGCTTAALIAELERLRARADADPALARLAATPAPAAPVPPPADLATTLAALLGTTAATLTGDPAAHQAQVEQVRIAATSLAAALTDPATDEPTRAAAATRLRQVLADTAAAAGDTAHQRAADLPNTLAALGVDGTRLAAAARTVADWLEQRTPAAGAAVDRLIASLDAAAAPLLGDDRARADAELTTRARDAARAAIAARLRKPPAR